MSNWLQSLREKPRAARSRYAFFGASSVTAVIAGVWLVTNIATEPQQPQQAASADDSQNTGVIESVFSQVKQQAAAVINAATDVAEEVNTESEETATSSNVVIPDVSKATFSSSTNPTKKAPTATGRTILIATTTASSTDAQ